MCFDVYRILFFVTFSDYSLLFLLIIALYKVEIPFVCLEVISSFTMKGNSP